MDSQQEEKRGELASIKTRKPKLVNSFLNDLLNSNFLNYLVINSEGTIQSTSAKLSRFTEGQTVILGGSVYLYFPELIGLGDVFTQITQDSNSFFELKGISRYNEGEPPFYIDLYLGKIKNAKNEQDQLILLIDDATERMNIRQELGQIAKECSLELTDLEATKDYLAKVITAIKEVLIVTTKKGKIKTINPAASKLFGYAADELIDQSLSVIFIRDNCCEQALEEVQQSSESLTTDIEVCCLTKKQVMLILEFSCSTIKAQHKGDLENYVWIGRDITHRKQVEEQLLTAAERDRLLGKLTQRIRQSLSLEEILKTTVAEVRQFLQSDRVIVFRLFNDGSGVVVAESVASPWLQILGANIQEPIFSENYIPQYREGRIRAIDDIYRSSLDLYHIDLLSRFQVKANLIVPILLSETNEENRLWGLIIAHHCAHPRQWQQWEIDLLTSLSAHLGVAIQQAELYEQLQIANQELEALATIDELTQIANRRHFDRYLNTEWRRLARDRAPISLILADVDYFKGYNDSYGHLVGDFCLQQVAKALRDSVKRVTDLVARYGGEEFTVVLPNTDLEGAVYVAEAIQAEIRALAIAHSSSTVSPYVSLSLGVASIIPTLNQDPQVLIASADRALYQAKTEGRDCLISISL